MALFEIIKKEKEDTNLISKYPKNRFNTSSQLIVHEGQEALFFKDGKALDLFGPGRYTLTTDNIPLLRVFLEIPTGGKSPFQCEVYFINKTEQNSKWGTSSKIEFLEPKYQFPIQIGACGEIRFQIEDSRKFLLKLVGIKSNFNETNLDDFFHSFILVKVKTYIAKIITEEKISIFEIDQQLEHFSEELKEKLQEEFDDFGIRLTKFLVTTIAKPEEDKQYLRFKELYFNQSVGLAEKELSQKFKLIEEETKAKGVVISSAAEATKRAQEHYTYQEERGFDIGSKVAQNEAVGQYTNVGVGMGMISGIGGTVANEVSKTVTGAFTELESEKVCPHCKTKNKKELFYCKNCGSPLNQKICEGCGFVLENDANFCSKCGKKVE